MSVWKRNLIDFAALPRVLGIPLSPMSAAIPGGLGSSPCSNEEVGKLITFS